MSSGSSQPTQTTTTQMSPEARSLYNLALPGVQSFAASTPQRYQGSTVAGFDPNQVAGQEGALSAAGAQNSLASGAAGSLPFFFGDIWNPSSNPNLQGAIDASVRPIQQNLTENELPAIRSEFSGGNYGGSRQGIAEGLAVGRTNQAIGDTASKVAQNQYDTNVNAQLRAYGLLPTVQGAQTAGSLTTSGVGDVRQARDQALLNENVGNFNYDQLAPFLQSKEILSLLTGLPGGTTTTTASTPGSPGVSQALGGAAAGAGIGGAIGGPLGAGIGAAGGAALPFLFR